LPYRKRRPHRAADRSRRDRPNSLAGLGASSVSAGGAGVDIGPIVDAGVPGIGHRVHSDRYFDDHHSPADTLEKVNPEHLAANVVAVAGLLWGLANDDAVIPRSTE
jgi:hypothetical protein